MFTIPLCRLGVALPVNISVTMHMDPSSALDIRYTFSSIRSDMIL
jgi:hypothetical protein